MKLIKLYLIFIELIFISYFSMLDAKNLYNPGEILMPDYSFLGRKKLGRIGYYLSSAGDVNNDGFGDFMIGAYHDSKYYYDYNSGAVFLMLGKAEINWRLNSSVNIADAVLRGKQAQDFVGYNIAGEGDFNGDGIDDLLIGAPGNWERDPPNSGFIYILFGKENVDWGDNFILEDYADKIIVGENDYDQFGYAVSFIGDVNRDGYDDILCGAPFRNQNDEWDGKVYLILGTDESKSQILSATEEAVATFIYPSYKGVLGSAVAGVDDVNQDGFVDFLIGAPGIGTTFLVFGKSNLDWGQNFDLHNADCKFFPETEGDDGGWQVSSAGDVNDDGFPDFIISGLAIKWDAGKIYLILGRTEWPLEGMLLSQADASYVGESNSLAGCSISGIKDFNGDGYDDFIIGARCYRDGERDKGKAYIIEGKSDGWSRDVRLSEVKTYFIGEGPRYCVGWGVSSAGDVNGDYRNDFIISAPWSSEGIDFSGKVYLFMGDFPLSQIEGRTVYYVNDHPVPNVRLTLSGDDDDFHVSDVDGQYQFNISHGDSFTVTPSKKTYSAIGEGFISVYDAALIALHTVHLDTLNKSAQIAADVNLDGQVTMYDASLIACFAVKMLDTPESYVGEWKFDPENRKYHKSNLSSFNQDYSCTLLGDVSGNWQPDTSQTTLTQEILQDIQVSSQEDISVPISIVENLSMISAEIHFTYEADVLELVAVNKTNLTKDFQVVYNEKNQGELIIGMYGLKSVNEAGKIVDLDFRLISNRGEKSCIKLERLQLNDYKPLKSEAVLQFSSSVKKQNTPNYNLIWNYPNPFNPETVIEYNFQKSTTVTLTILNVMGRVVKTLDSGFKEAGKHKVVWTGRDNAGNEVSSGIYICHLTCNEYSVKKKMLKLK